ncbi:MAG: hypothetical protein ABW101_10780 [Candidatus Thiodiazotropha sp.]
MSESHLIFVHGLANKPPVEDLRRIWLEALAEPHDGDEGFDLGAVGVRDYFVYWADLFYKQPLAAADYESRSNELQDSVSDQVDLSEDEWMRIMREKFDLDEDEPFDNAPVEATVQPYERIPLPGFAKKKIMKHFLQEAHDYLYNKDGMRDTIRQRVMDALTTAKNAGGPVVLVGHSQGTFIAYDVLTGVPDCPQIDGFMTFGSPLGIDEVQDRLVWTRDNGFPEKVTGDWVNVYDPFDVVARLDPKLANDFKRQGEPAVIDLKEENWGTWRHSATKYLKGNGLREHLRRLADRD